MLQGSQQPRSLEELMTWLDADRNCRFCGKQFLPLASWKQRFDRHLNTHSGARPFSCPYCTYSCSRKDALKLHLGRRHSTAEARAENLNVSYEFDQLTAPGFERNFSGPEKFTSQIFSKNGESNNLEDAPETSASSSAGSLLNRLYS